MLLTGIDGVGPNPTRASRCTQGRVPMAQGLADKSSAATTIGAARFLLCSFGTTGPDFEFGSGLEGAGGGCQPLLC